MKRLKTTIQRLLFVFILGTIVSACSCCPGKCLPELPCCFDLRRPPVMMVCPDYVLDYVPDECKPCNSCGCNDCGGCQTGTCDLSSCDEGCRIGSNGNSHSSSVEEFIGQTSPYDPIVKEYRISVGDVLEISVFGDEDSLVDNVMVAPDGKIYYLHLDGFYAAGMTLNEVKQILATELSDLYLAPNVTIIPRVMSNQSFTILGRVNVPGLYPLERSTSIRQAIGMAGGIMNDPEYIAGSDGLSVVSSYTDFNRSATDLKNAFIVRNGKRLSIDFDKLITSADNSQDILIQPGDYIYISPEESKEVYVMGGVFSPSALPYSNGLTLIGALTRVGGWTYGTPYTGDWNKVLIVRGELDCPCCFCVNVHEIMDGHARDFCLLPGDIVYVYNKKFRFGRQLIRLAVDSFVAAFVNSAAVYYVDKLFDEDDD